MGDDSNFSLAILERSIEERERKLCNPLLSDSPHLAARLNKELEALRRQKQTLKREAKRRSS